MLTSQKRRSEVVTVKVNPVKFLFIVMISYFPGTPLEFQCFPPQI